MHNLKKTQKVVGVSIVAALMGLSLTAIAGGFQLFEENVTNLGNAFAGVAAEADDSTTEYFNPAGMTLLDNGQVTASATDISLKTEPHVKSATSSVIISAGPVTLPPITTTVTGPTELSTSAPPVPSFHFVYPFHHKWALGFGANAPFGLPFDYSDQSITRFLATDSSVQVIDIGPSLAYQLTPEFSLGAGVSSQYMDATFNQMLPGPFGGTDGKFTNDGDNWGIGWHAGALYQITPNSRVGLAYHSQVHHELKGNSTITINSPGTTFAGFTVPGFQLAVPGKFTANTTLPDYGDLSLYHDFNCQWAFLGDIEWTDWSTFDVITANFSGDIANNGIVELKSAQLPFHFKNTWRISGGLNYKPWQRLTLRSGIAYDESPVRDDETRTFRLPDNDRFWVALGARYIINKAFTVDVGYSHLFIKSFSNNNTQVFNAVAPNIPIIGPVNIALVENGVADFDASANEFGGQITWNFTSL